MLRLSFLKLFWIARFFGMDILSFQKNEGFLRQMVHEISAVSLTDFTNSPFLSILSYLCMQVYLKKVVSLTVF